MKKTNWLPITAQTLAALLMMAAFLLALSAEITGANKTPGIKETSAAPAHRESLLGDSQVYDHQLAQASLDLAVAAFEKAAGRRELEALGFSDIQSYRYGAREDEDKAAALIGSCEIKGRPVVAIAVRGGNYGDEWGSNGRLGWPGPEGTGARGYHCGFHEAAEDLLGALAEYCGARGIVLAEAAVWVTGFSRGAGVANVLGHQLMEYGVTPPGSVFCYTFASPATVSASHGSPRHPGIYNIVNNLDIVCRLPMNCSGTSQTASGKSISYNWDYTRYGTTIQLGDGTEKQLMVVDLLEHSLAFATRNEETYVSRYQDQVIIPLFKEKLGKGSGKRDRRKILNALIEALPGVAVFLSNEVGHLTFGEQLYIGNMLSGADQTQLLKEHDPSVYKQLLEEASL